jgi:hypothetical protein
MVRVGRLCPFVAARIWLAHTTADPVSGEPMQRSPFLAAQIGLDIVDWREVWAMLEFCEASQMQRHGMVNPPQSDRAPRNGRQPALQWAPLAKWKQERARRITPAEYAAEISWLSWAQRNRPDHPDFNFRRPVDLRAAPVPRFAP